MKKLIFVYDANTGLFNKSIDYAHKLISPQTYNCNLCRLTYDNIGMKKKWKAFLSSLNFEIEFLYKDEFRKKWNSNCSFPAIFILEEQPIILANKEKIESMSSVDELIELVKAIVYEIG